MTVCRGSIHSQHRHSPELNIRP
uniref:Uncharacterized protein n=1 Tax=Anguilla anguilla TaxID=7936 RepID=A0A0E9QG86_ANGAN